jgi:hypothetical protein
MHGANRFGKFGFLDSTRISVSMRRMGKEGLVGFGLKYGWCEMYALMGKPIRSVPFNYEFGTFAPPQSPVDRGAINQAALSRQLVKFRHPLQRFGRGIWDRLNL